MLYKKEQPTKKKVSKLEIVRYVVSAILLIAGIALIATKPIKQTLMKQQSESTKSELKALTPEDVKSAENSEASYDYDAVHSISLDTILAAQQNKSKAPMIGEIAIPDVGINLPVVKGVSDDNLLVGAATMKPEQKMGIGNYTLASHYSDAYDETLLFAPLIRARAGMKIYLTDLSKVYTYEITSVTLVEPTAVEVLDETGENIITLVTCNDMSATQRRIVRGKLVSVQNASDVSSDIASHFEAEFKTY